MSATPMPMAPMQWCGVVIDKFIPLLYSVDEKHLNNMSEYFVGVANIVFNRYNNRFL